MFDNTLLKLCEQGREGGRGRKNLLKSCHPVSNPRRRPQRRLWEGTCSAQAESTLIHTLLVSRPVPEVCHAACAVSIARGRCEVVRHSMCSKECFGAVCKITGELLKQALHQDNQAARGLHVHPQYDIQRSEHANTQSMPVLASKRNRGEKTSTAFKDHMEAGVIKANEASRNGTTKKWGVVMECRWGSIPRSKALETGGGVIYSRQGGMWGGVVNRD
eukprot:762947-Hanusia_phi.AAC.5